MRRNLQQAHRRAAGFTLIELTISSALMAMVLVAAYLCLNAGFATQRMLDPRLEATQTARVALGLMAADLRCACQLSKDAEFIGMKRTLGGIEAGNIDFATHNYTPARAGEGDYCEMSYFLDLDRQAGVFVLWRRRNPRIGIDPFSGGSREEIARGVRQLKFEFYDGFDWYETWGDPDGKAKDRGSLKLEPNLYGMPEAVRITLALAPGWKPSLSDADAASTAPSPSGPPDASKAASPETTSGSATSTARNEEPALVFQTVARLNLAHSSTASSSGTSSSESSGGSPAVPGPNAPPGGPQ